MKKLLATLVSLFLVACMTFSLTACNKEGEEFKGKYKETTKEELQTIFDSITEANKLNLKHIGDEFYTKMSMEQASDEDSITTDLQIAYSKENKLLSAYILSSLTSNGQEESAEIATYIDEEYSYAYLRENEVVSETMNAVTAFDVVGKAFISSYEAEINLLIAQAINYFKVALENEDLIGNVTIAKGKDFVNLKLNYNKEIAQAGEEYDLLTTYSDASGEVILSFRSEDYSIRAAKISVNEQATMLGQEIGAVVFLEIASLKEDVQVPEVLKSYYEMKNK